MRIPLTILLLLSVSAVQAQVGVDKSSTGITGEARPVVHATTEVVPITPEILEALVNDTTLRKTITVATTAVPGTLSSQRVEHHVTTGAYRPGTGTRPGSLKTVNPTGELPPGRMGPLIVAPTIGATLITAPE